MADVTVDMIIEALAKGFDKVEKDLKGLGDAGEKSEKGIEKAGKQTGFLDTKMKQLIAGGALLAAGKALLDFGRASITAASDVEEMQSKFNTVFRDLAGPVTAELETFAEAANRSKFDLMGFAATLQDTFVPLGFARDEAAEMSVTMVKLAEDLASFNNLNTEDVVRDLQSALVGNTETLRKYGVVAQEAQIKQEALSTGLWDGTGAIDAQSKAQAILQLTMKGTTDAQGDAIKTADSYANVSKGTEAAMTDLKVAIGEGLIPVMAELQGSTADTARELTGLIQIKNELAKAVRAGIITQEDFVDIQLRAALTSESLAEASEEIIKIMEELETKTEGVTKNQEKQVYVTGELAAADAILLSHVDDLQEAEDRLAQTMLERSQASQEAFETDSQHAENLELVAASQAAYNERLKEGIVVSGHMTEATEDSTEALEEARQAMASYFTEAINTKDGIGLYNETAAQMADRTIFVSDLTRDQKVALSDLQAEYDKAQGIINEYTIGVKGVGLSTEEVNEKVAEQQERMAELQGAMEPLIAIGGDYADVQGTMTINEDALNQSIFDSVQAAGASAEQMAILGGALGLYSDEAVEAALKTAAIQIKIDELAASYVAGDISVEGMRESIQDFIASLDAVPDAVTTNVSISGIDSAIARVGNLRDQLNALGGQVSAAEAAGATQRTGGGVGLQHGADFVVPPGFPNDSFGPLFVQSGERVTVTPPGQAGARGSSQQFTMYNPQFYGVNDSQDMLKQLQDLSM